MTYFLIFLALTILSLADPRRLYWPVLLALLLFAIFRFETGCDWNGYLNQYKVQGLLPFEEAILDPEPLWGLVLFVQRSLGISYPWLNVFAGCVFFIGVHQVAKRHASPFIYLVLLFPILIVNMPMSAIKQATAIGVMCFAFIAFVDKRLIRFIILVFVAAAIHNSAALFLLLSPLVTGEITKRRLFLAAILALPGLAALLTTEGAEVATERYIVRDIEAAGAIYRVMLLSLTGLAHLYFLKKRWVADEGVWKRLTYIGALLMIGCLVLLPVSTVIGDRFGYYLIPIQAYILANFRYAPFPHFRRLIVAAPFIVLLVTFAVWTTYSNHFIVCYTPYESWLFGYPNSNLHNYRY